MQSKLKRNKRAISELLSWVLLIGVVLVIGAIVAVFITDAAEKTKTDIITEVDQQECQFTSISVTDMCQKPLNLYINITNNNLLTITELKFRLVDINSNTENSVEDIDLLPGETQDIVVLKGDITQKLEIVPVTQKDNRVIICESSKYSTETIIGC